MKVAIIGYSGSGKSTFAKALSEIYCIPVLYLDCVHFLADWEERPIHDSRQLVQDFMQQNSDWVIDGNYGDFYQEQRLSQADQIFFFNFSRLFCLKSVILRYLSNRDKTRESMAAGCIEKIDLEFIWWVLYEGRNKSHRQHYADIKRIWPNKLIEFTKRKQVTEYIAQLQKLKATQYVDGSHPVNNAGPGQN